MATADTPPWWSPELENNAEFPYSIDEWCRDVKRWTVATRVAQERQGPLLSLALGSIARTIADEISEEVLSTGAAVDLNDGRGQIPHSGVEILLALLRNKFPPDSEATMLRTGLDFFSFTPVMGEDLRSMFLRFDIILTKANTITELGISVPFRSWMVLSLLRLPPRKWAEILRDCGRRLPRTEAEYQTVKANLLRDRAIEENVQVLHNRNGSQKSHMFFTDDHQPLPLYLALANGGGEPPPLSNGSVRQPLSNGNVRQQANTDTTYDVSKAYLNTGEDDDSEAGWSTDTEWWEQEDLEDHYDEERLEAEEQAGSNDPQYLCQVWWAARTAERRFRAASGRFRPKHVTRKRRFGANRVTKRGPPAQAGGRPRKGFFINSTFVSLEHVPQQDLQVFFEGGNKWKDRNREKRGAPRAALCFKCGKPGHLAAACSSSESLCFNCGKPGHIKANCKAPPKQKTYFTADYGSDEEAAEALWGEPKEALALGGDEVWMVNEVAAEDYESRERPSITGKLQYNNQPLLEQLSSIRAPEQRIHDDGRFQYKNNLVDDEYILQDLRQGDTITFKSTGTILAIGDAEIQVRDLQTGGTSMISTTSFIARMSKNTSSSSTTFPETQNNSYAHGHSQLHPQAQEYVPQQFREQPQFQHHQPTKMAKSEKASQKSYDTLSALLGTEVVPLERMETFAAGSNRMETFGLDRDQPSRAPPNRMETFGLGGDQPRRIPENYNLQSPHSGLMEALAAPVPASPFDEWSPDRQYPQDRCIPCLAPEQQQQPNQITNTLRWGKQVVLETGSTGKGPLKTDCSAAAMQRGHCEPCRHFEAGQCIRKDCIFCHHPKPPPYKPPPAQHGGSFYNSPPGKPKGDKNEPWSMYKGNAAATFAVFEWDEECKSTPSTDAEPISVFNHSATRLSEHEEGLLVDTGSRFNITGGDLVERQSSQSSEHGLVTQWKELKEPRLMSGVGKGVQQCTREALIHGVVAEGDLITYKAPVLEESGKAVPGLYGLDPMADRNTYVGTATGKLHMIPPGTDDQIIWPKGTKTLSCVKSRSGHWMLPISKWDKYNGGKVQEAFPTEFGPYQ